VGWFALVPLAWFSWAQPTAIDGKCGGGRHRAKYITHPDGCYNPSSIHENFDAENRWTAEAD
jgi:hypothetical protein